MMNLMNMMNKSIRSVALSAAVLSGASMLSAPLAAADVPRHPNELKFEPLKFEPPDAEQYRHTLSTGVTVYMAPDHEFPLINVSFAFKGGAYLEPADKPGLASITGQMIRQGGTAGMAPAAFDEEVDFYAANIGAAIGGTQSGASLNTLVSNFDETFKLFMEMVRSPRFDAERLAVVRGQAIEGMKQRNDDADSILGREQAALMFGRDHFEAREATIGSIESITESDMRALHERIFNPAAGNLIIAVTGDFDETTMLAKLEKALAGWKPGAVNPDPPAPTATFEPGVYHIEKDIPQGKVQIGLRSVTRDDPDYFKLLLMNEILGGGGFTSRVTKRVRSDEGLAYSAGTGFAPRVWYPGEFSAFFQSKNPTVALATKIILEEMERIRTEPVTAEELDVAKNSFIETFPRTFESKAGMLGVFVGDEMTKRPAGYWKTYRDKIRAVTPADVQQVAQKYLDPSKVMVFIVGKWAEIAKGDIDGRASMSEIFSGEVTHLPLRDPLTLEPLPQQ